MSTRRHVLASLGAGLLAVPFASFAREPGRPWRVGVLASRRRPDSLDTDYLGEIQRGLRDLGYVEGKDVAFEWRFANGAYERLPALATELVGLKVDVIVTDGTPSTLAAQKATRTVPIVFGGVGDPLGNGIVKSLARPGGNATGLSLLGEDTNRKQLELLSRMVPKLTRVAALCNLSNPTTPPLLKSLQAAAREAGLEVFPVEARNAEEMESAFASLGKERAGALVVIMDPFFIQQGRRIAEMAEKRRLPSMASLREYAESGGLMSYGQNRVYNYRRAAAYVDRILKGARPGDLPIEQSMKLELVLNRRTAKALGLEIPAELLVLADKVIE